ncbi:MAG: multidrug efflux MFS transporter [Chloroflexi bacterium]|nr:multidrug efflux MFS transporter [Chloroflexota bacterium]OJV89407.1 MAG: hypothetical protein BGO39_36115 [Chloroflexi bacterium 54-19]
MVSNSKMAPTALSNKWLVIVTVVFGSFMAMLDSTIVNIAVPQLRTAFGVGIDDVQWVVTAYLLTLGVVTPLSAYFANNFGIKRSYLVSLFIFTLGSLLCGISWDLPSLVVFRVLQAVGGAAILPLSITIALRAFPPEQRGLAVSSVGVPTLLAPVLGPVLGGYIITYAHWSLIFFINLPIGLVGLVLGWFVLVEARHEKRSRFDWPGFLAIGYGTAAIIYAVTEVTREGWGSLKVEIFLWTGALALALFVVVEVWKMHRGADMLLDLRLFRYRSFVVGNLALVVYIFALMGATFLIPIYLQELRGQNAFDAGTTMIFQAITSMVFSLLGGRLADRIGARPVVLTGLTILAVITWFFTSLQLDTPFWMLDIFLAVRGVGLGLTSQPLVAASLADVRGAGETASASTVTTVIRNVVGSVAVAILATIVQSNTATHLQTLSAQPGQANGSKLLGQQAALLGMQDAFTISIFLVLAGIGAVFFLKGGKTVKVTAPSPQPVTEPEKFEVKS